MPGSNSATTYRGGGQRRILALARELEQRRSRGETLAQLAARHGVTPRTVARDLNVLREMGYRVPDQEEW